MQYITKKFDGIDTPVIFRKGRPFAQSPDYPGINERTYVLPQGSRQREDGMALQADIVVEQDVPVTLRDGTVIRCDVYRPNKAGKFPAIMGWSPYGKRGSCFDNGTTQRPPLQNNLKTSFTSNITVSPPRRYPCPGDKRTSCNNEKCSSTPGSARNTAKSRSAASLASAA